MDEIWGYVEDGYDAFTNLFGDDALEQGVRAGLEYALGDDDKRIDIGFKTYRSKAGAAGKTNNTMAYSTDMQNCFKTGEKP